MPGFQGGALYVNTIPTTGFFRAGDGGWLFIRCHHSDEAVARLCRAMGRPELAEDQRFSTGAARHANGADVRVAVEE